MSNSFGLNVPVFVLDLDETLVCTTIDPPDFADFDSFAVQVLK